jgi:hypothetical protein
LVGAVADLPQQLTGLLGGPGGGGMGSDAEDVHSSGAHFPDEQCVEALEPKSCPQRRNPWQKPAGLSGEEGAPLAASSVSLWWGAEDRRSAAPCPRWQR